MVIQVKTADNYDYKKLFIIVVSTVKPDTMTEQQSQRKVLEER